MRSSYIYFFFCTLNLGLAVLLILLPLNAIVWTIMENFQSKQMIMKDERVRVITEIMAGIKVLKLFSWEESFINKIGIFQQEVYWFYVRININ